MYDCADQVLDERVVSISRQEVRNTVYYGIDHDG